MSKCLNCGEKIPLDYEQVGGVHMSCEHQYFHEKNQRMIKVRPGKGYPWAVMTPLEADGVKDGTDETLESEEIYMTKFEVNNLKDFVGW